MHLYLTSNSPWDTTYCTDSGQVIYKADSRWSLGPRHITISRIRPAPSVEVNEDGKVPDEALKDEFAEIGKVVWRAFTYSRIRVGEGQEMSTKDFFRKEGWGYYGRGRIFTGPDGREYIWKMDTVKSKLYTYATGEGNVETLVANFHQRHLGIIGEARPPSLEIEPGFEHMSDLIVITFIFIEKRRRAKEKQRRSGGGD